MLHFAHPEQALSEVFRVLKPGGKFTFSVWAPPEDFPMFGLLGDVVAEFGNLDGASPAHQLRFSREDGARHAENAGFFLDFVASDFEAPLSHRKYRTGVAITSTLTRTLGRPTSRKTCSRRAALIERFGNVKWMEW